MVLWKFTLREIETRPGRALLTLLSIVLAVAAVVAVSVSTATTHQSYQQMYDRVTGRAALEVVAEGGGIFREEIVPELEKIPGVKAVVPSFQQPTNLLVGERKVRMLVLGIDPERDEAARDYELVEGTFFQGDDGALMEAGLARALGVGLNDEVRLQAWPPRDVRIIGLLSPRGAAGFNQGGIVFLPLRAAQAIYRKPRNINNVAIILQQGADEAQVRGAIEKTLPTGVIVRAPAARTQLAKETLLDAEQGLTYAYVLTLILACFMILNTFLMNVQERRGQMAVLRALGTTRGQVTGMLLREGLMMGAVGTGLGIVLGLGGAYLLNLATAQLYAVEMPGLRLTWEPFLLAAVLGPGVSLLAAYIPARLAGRVAPLEGMRPVVSGDSVPFPVWFTVAGIGLFATSGAVLVASAGFHWPPLVAILSGSAFGMSFVLLIPAVLSPLSRGVAAILRPVLGVEGRLAQRQLLRRRVRTALTIALLYIAVSSGLSLGTTILNNVEAVRNWYKRTAVGDFFVRAMFPDMATGQAAEMPESLGDELRAIEGVTSVGTVRFITSNVGDQSVIVMLRDFAGRGDLPLDLQVGDPQDARERLLAGEVVIGTVLAKRLGVGVGDSITLDTRSGPQRLRVAATTTEYMVGGMVVHMDRSVGKRLLSVEGVDAFVIKAAPESLHAAEERLQAICQQNGLMLHSFVELSRRVDSLMNGVIAGLWGLLALGFVVAGFAMANTLTMNVLEQTRDLALLRVVAMTRRQVRKTILAQAAIIGLVGLATGVVGGISGAYVFNLTMALSLARSLVFAIDPTFVVSTFVVALAIVLAAAWLPAARASRLNLLIALHYE